LLCYALFHYEPELKQRLYEQLLDFYTAGEISLAKDSLWSACSNLGEKQRRATSATRSAKEANLLDILDAIQRINDDDACDIPVFSAVNLGRIPPGLSTDQFPEASLRATQSIAKDIAEIKVNQDIIRQAMEDAVISTKPDPSQPTYASILSQSPEAQVRRSRTQRVPQLVEPKHTLIVENIQNPLRFRDNLFLFNTVQAADDTIGSTVSTAKLVANGNVFFEARDEESLKDLEPKLSAILPTIFGPEAKIRPMVNPTRVPSKSIVVHNLPSLYDHDTILEAVKVEYPSATTILDLRAQGSTARYRSVKIVLDDINEFSLLLKHGLRIGWEIFRADEWVRPPLQCFNCQRYGHISRNCRSQRRCINCAHNHAATDECSGSTKCANCGGDHKANRSSCPARAKAISDQRAQSS
jgi:hypothetical protein